MENVTDFCAREHCTHFSRIYFVPLHVSGPCPDKLYSTLRSMTYQSSICAFWLWPGGKLQSDLGPHSMQFVVVPNLFAAVACHCGIASADREMRLCSMVSCSTSMRIRRSLIEASQDSQGARAKSNANAGV